MNASNKAVHPPTPELTRSVALALPDPKRLLAWLHLGRLTLVTAVLIGFVGPVTKLEVTLAAAATLLSVASFWYIQRNAGRTPTAYLYAQLALDAVLLTGVVHLSGGAESVFAPFYILLIGMAALLLSTSGGILMGSFVVALYLASNHWGSGGAVDSAVILQTLLFVGVGPVIGYLGGRLRAAGTALGELQSELAQLRLDTGEILDTMNTGVLTVDASGTLAYINPAGEELLQLSGARWVGEPVFAQLDRAAPGLGSIIDRSARESIPIRRSETRPTPGGEFVLGVSTTVLDRGEEGGVMVTAIFQDITVRKRVEALRRRSERLEAVAALSASLAHEIKNPLASIRSAVEQLGGADIEPGDDKLLKGLVVRESDRLSRLLSEFLDFARVQITAAEPIEVRGLVQGIVDLVRAHPESSGRSVKIQHGDGAEELWCRGSEDLLHRAVFNLVLNAVQWAGDEGEVRLSLDELTSDLLAPAAGAAHLIRLTVTDTGPGVPHAIRDEIFDPFFTRRPGGTGLGLALVQRAVEAHSGAIFVDDSADASRSGATFTLYLPALGVEDPVRGFASPFVEVASF